MRDIQGWYHGDNALFSSCVTLKFWTTYCFCGGMNSLVHFTCSGYTALFYKKKDEFFTETAELTFFVSVAVGFAFL